MKNSAGPGPKYEALLELLRASESLWNASRLFFSRWSLSPSQFNVLNLLFDAPEGRSQTELSRLLIMHRSNLTGLADRLEQRGLVERRPLDSDRRANRIVLTQAGRDLVREVRPHYYEAAEAVWAGVPASGIQPLVNQIALLRQNLESMKPTLSKTAVPLVAVCKDHENKS